jgi:hypothetical protein
MINKKKKKKSVIQVQLYLTAPGVEMRRTILENQLGCLKDSQLESTQENQFKSTQNQLESTRENHLESPQNQLESTREKQMKSTQENQLESTQGSRIESAQNQSAQRSLSDALKRKVIETVLPLSHSYMPVDLVRVCNTVLMYFAKHRGCTAGKYIRSIPTYFFFVGELLKIEVLLILKKFRSQSVPHNILISH